MATLILIIALVVEVGFAAYCIATQSNQPKVRSYVRLGAFAAFVLFTLVSVIQWSFRWYLLAALLLVLAALGAWTLLRKPEEKKGYRAGWVVFRAVSLLVIVGLALTPAFILPQYRLPTVTGQFAVATVNFTYTDPSRLETFTDTGENRKVNVEFWYPKDASGPYPLVVFSHGAFGMKGGNTSTFVELASHGYVVVSVDHPYHALYTRGADGQGVLIDQGFLQEFMDSNNHTIDEAARFELTQKWMSLRTADLNFVLDTILQQAADPASEPVYRLINPAKIGLIGHSLGGAASVQLGRERSDVGAVINLDGDLLGEALEYADGSYTLNTEVYPVPILSIYSADMLRLFAAHTDPTFVNPWTQITATASDAYEVDFPGANHMSLTDLPIISPLAVSLINAQFHIGGGPEADKYYILETMNACVLQFFDVYLKDVGSFTDAGTY